MLKRLKNVLLLDDKMLNCNCTDLDIDKIDISTVALPSTSIDEFEMVIYNGKHGMKILKSTLTPTGVVGRK